MRTLGFVIAKRLRSKNPSLSAKEAIRKGCFFAFKRERMLILFPHKSVSK